MMKISTIGFILLACVLSFSAGVIWKKNAEPLALTSFIFPKAEARNASGDWGDIYIYTEDTTTTYGTKNMLTAVLELLPGRALHPPHQHTQEEFMFIVNGSGTWSLNGKEYPIRKGDLMYARPWDMHGISNTSSDTLSFFVVKWDNKGVKLPEKMDDDRR